MLLEAELLAHMTTGLALATATLLATLAALAATKAEAPLGDEARIAALALAAAAVLSAAAVAVHRAVARRPSPLRSLMKVDPSGELATAYELGTGPSCSSERSESRALGLLAVAQANERAATIDLSRALPRSAPREAV
ncbi:MAG: hypothetical protein ACAI25_01660, partial [Planctomycetota bacterium]